MLHTHTTVSAAAELRSVVVPGDIIATIPVQLVARTSHVRTFIAYARVHMCVGASI